MDRRVPLRSLVADALGDLFALDSRVLRTLRPLFLRPGFLTAEWCRGRRVPYVPPLRLYIFVAAVFFFVLAVTETSLVQIDTTVRGVPAPEAAAEALDVAAFQDRFVDHLGRLSLLLPPVLALLLALVYRGRRRLLVEHLVASLHLHAFAFLVLSAAAFLPEAPWGRGARTVLVAVLPVYAFLSLRRVYGGPWWGTAARMALLVLGYMILAVLPAVYLAFVWTRATSL